MGTPLGTMGRLAALKLGLLAGWGGAAIVIEPVRVITLDSLKRRRETHKRL
ncbi:MAG TPA: hypothetical protein VF478_13025 [Anaerolineae bacterium]